MTGNQLLTSSTTGLDFSEKEKKALKIHITEKMQGLNITSSMSLGRFFSLIEIVSLGDLPYSVENISKWNTWVRGQKVICIELPRANAVAMPIVKPDKLMDFFKTLVDIGILDQTNDEIGTITQKVTNLLTSNSTL